MLTPFPPNTFAHQELNDFYYLLQFTAHKLLELPSLLRRSIIRIPLKYIKSSKNFQIPISQTMNFQDNHEVNNNIYKLKIYITISFKSLVKRKRINDIRKNFGVLYQFFDHIRV